LGLAQRVRVHEQRIDPEAPSAPGLPPPTLACSRATFPPARWLALGLRLAPSVLVLVARESLPEAPRPARLAAERRYVLPGSGAQRAIGLYTRDERVAALSGVAAAPGSGPEPE
jgi:hypothetical protein